MDILFPQDQMHRIVITEAHKGAVIPPATQEIQHPDCHLSIRG